MRHPDPDESLPLKEACLRAAREAIAEHGVEQLSLREVARRLGVSHQAPYRHYPSRDHLLVAVMRCCFRDFAAFLDDRGSHADPRQDLGALGARYLAYAAGHPVEYRLMFGTPWPAVGEGLGLAADAIHAFDVLRRVLRRLHADADPAATPAVLRSRVDLDAMVIWANMHGMATLTQSSVMAHLALAPQVEAGAAAHMFTMLSVALQARAAAPAAMPAHPPTAAPAAPRARRRRAAPAANR